jgi:hypothetical protein
MYFARLQADIDTKLRRGAWYRVLQIHDLEAVIEVNRQPVRVVKAFLEIQKRPPLRWTVVPKPAQTKRAAAELGPTYGVCPSCRTRAPLKPKAREMDCPHCKGSFAVAWDEGYLKS